MLDLFVSPLPNQGSAYSLPLSNVVWTGLPTRRTTGDLHGTLAGRQHKQTG